MLNPSQIPVLLLVFNRPDHAVKVAERLVDIGASKVFIAADAPRPDRAGEAELCRKTLELVEKTLLPRCEVQWCIREHNLGCRKAVSTAIDWFFSHVEEGIVLEDDCLPNPSFFSYCASLLDKYRDDSRIMHISGNNFFEYDRNDAASYHFSRVNHCWGWATWARAWKLYDHDLDTLDEFLEKDRLKDIFKERYLQHYLYDILRAVREGRIDSWAYIWGYSCYSNSGLTCRPHVNLVSNIGFDSGTRTEKGDIRSDMRDRSIELPLVHPRLILANAQKDRKYYCYRFGYQFYRHLEPIIRSSFLFRPFRALVKVLWRKKRREEGEATGG